MESSDLLKFDGEHQRANSGSELKDSMDKDAKPNVVDNGAMIAPGGVRRMTDGQDSDAKAKTDKKKKRKSIVSSLPGRHYGFRRKESKLSRLDAVIDASPISESAASLASSNETEPTGNAPAEDASATAEGDAALPDKDTPDSGCRDIVISVPRKDEMSLKDRDGQFEPIYDTVPYTLSPVTETSTVLFGADDDVDLLFARWCKLRGCAVVEERVRRMGLAWLPAGMADSDVSEFLSGMAADEVPRLGSTGARRRLLSLLRQVPLRDLSADHNRHLAPRDVPVFREFTVARDLLAIDEGHVSRLTTPTDCRGCQETIAPGRLAVRAALLPAAAWHPGCFSCGSCREQLADLLYCQLRGQLLCVHDYGQQLHDRCARCDELIFSGEYARAQELTWHHECLQCQRCGEKLAGGEFGLKDKVTYCLGCYGASVASTCAECQHPVQLSDQEMRYGGKHWHAACFLCSSCRTSLQGKPFGLRQDRLLCATCVTDPAPSPTLKPCSGCGQEIATGSRFMESQLGQWHEQCFTCCTCRRTLESRTFLPKEGRLYCSRCYEETFAARCCGCMEPITSVGVTYQGDTWHRDCFRCVGCSAGLAGHKFRSHDSRPFCGDCYREKFGRRCARCRQPMPTERGTKYSAFEDRCWHNACFTCARCNTSLVGRGFLDMDGDVVCPDCGRRVMDRFSPTQESSLPPGKEALPGESAAPEDPPSCPPSAPPPPAYCNEHLN